MDERITIMVVDDEKVIRDGCSLPRQPENYRVFTAPTAGSIGPDGLAQKIAKYHNQGKSIRPDGDWREWQ